MTEEYQNQEGELCTEISLNSVTNLFLSENSPMVDKYIDGLKKSLEPVINASVGRLGIDVTDVECRVLEAILGCFTETNYEGNFTEISRKELELKHNVSNFQSTNMDQIPRVRITQVELMRRLGIQRGSIGAISRAIEGLESLSSKIFSFFYVRKATDEDGNPLVDSKGQYKYEDVSAQGSLLTLLRITDVGDSRLKFYEIVLNPIFLEDRETHCLLIPTNWREEVNSIIGKKGATPTLFKFLIFLRYAYEVCMRNNEQKPFQIKLTPEEVAKSIRMAETIVKRNKGKMLTKLEECYSKAVKLGYLEDYKIQDFVHVLTLKDEKYISSLSQLKTGVEKLCLT